MRPNAPDTGSTFMQRLGYYALGISVGLLLLGWIQVQKVRARNSQPPPSSQVEDEQIEDQASKPEGG